MTEQKGILIHEAVLGYPVQGAVLSITHMHLQQGKLTGLAGFNGSGKSTLLRTLAGLQPLLSGKIQVNGKALSAYDRHQLARELSLVLTERVSGFNMTAYDAVASGRLPYTNMFHELKNEDKERIKQAMQMTGVSEYKERPLTELSDGMYQKTMIARAIAQDTSIILMDEPGAFLDFKSKHELFGLLSVLCKEQQKTIIVSSHELDLLLRYTDQMLLLEAGRSMLVESKQASSHEVLKRLSGGFL